MPVKYNGRFIVFQLQTLLSLTPFIDLLNTKINFMSKATSKKTPVKNGNKPAMPIKAEIPSETNSSMEELFLSGLKDTYWAEKHLVKAIPKMANAASSAELKKALTDHLEQTKGHVARLESIFQQVGKEPMAKKCDAMEGLVMSGEHVIENTAVNTPTRDTGIIMAGLKVENFEITDYKGLIQLANSLGKKEAAGLLQKNLNEEQQASDLLQSLSQKAA